MKVVAGTIPGLLIMEPAIHGDARGFFLEMWSRSRYAAAGLDVDFVQDNLSLSAQGILRGLHFQNPNPQGKLVQVLQGEVYDVVVDLRRSSPAFGRWEGFTLDGESKRQAYVPPGCAHGFAVLSASALFYYKCTAPYSPRDEMSLRWDDPDLDIRWPVALPKLSPKDQGAPRLRDIPKERLFD
jgi:dTDP-4-dehydrorhamnose 3,5-epimerase